MPIQITNFETKPAVAFDRVHCSELRIMVTEEQSPKARVRVVYKLYGHDADGTRHFDKAQHIAEIEDAYVEAAVRAGNGDMTLAQALGAIEGALAVIVSEQGGIGAATVV